MEALECQQYSVKGGFVEQLQQQHQHIEDYVEEEELMAQQTEEQHQLHHQHHQRRSSDFDEQINQNEDEDKKSSYSSMLSPNKVGHEFVKQYYRILYKAPEVLHRFYTNDSTCTRHDFNMVIGKREIQHLFQRENYRKCRTNIFNTDIHGTIANGVIVLVTGEQANMGSPMRSFVQTFVLAAEGPRKYYVSNDIFRYADIFTKSMSMLVDVECQTTSSIHHFGGDGDRDTAESSMELMKAVGGGGGLQQQNQQQQLHHQQQHQQQQQQQQLSSKAPVYDFYKSSIGLNCAIPMPRWASSHASRDSSVSGTYTHTYTQQETFTIQPDGGDGNVGENLPLSDYNASQEQEQQPPVGEYPYYRSLIAQALSPRMEFEEIAPQYVNGAYYNEDVSRASIGVSSMKAPKRRGEAQLQQQQHHYASRSGNEDQINSPMALNENQQQQQENQPPPTYAKLFMNALTRAGMKNNNNNSLSSNISSPMKGTNVVPNIYNAPRSNNDTTTSSPTAAAAIAAAKTTTTVASNQQQQQQQAMHGGHHNHMDGCNNNNNSNSNSYAPVHSQDYSPVQRNNYSSGMRRNERRRSSSAQKYNDNQQLFLGQIPHNATEEELVRIFSCFGNVLELRILPNLNGKIQPGAKHPLKYGFLTFEHVESVKACLESRPVYFPNNSPDGQKLNVRAKKPAVARDEQQSSMQQNCSSIDSQSLTSEWPQSRRNNSISSGGGSTIGSSAPGGGGGGVIGGGNNLNTVYNRKDNRNGRAASLDSSISTGPAPGTGGRKFSQVTNGGGVVNNGCGGGRR